MRFRKWLRFTLIIGGIVLVVLLAGWFILTAYVNSHKAQILKNITERISQDISGKLEIKDMEPTLWKSFPGISVRLDSVSLADSLYPSHHLKTLEFQSVFVRLSLPSLFTLTPKIKKIILSNGTIRLFTLANGYSNSYLFKGTESQKKKLPKHPSLRLLSAENVTLIAGNVPHHKLFKISFNNLNVSIKNKKNQLEIHARMDAFVHQLGFNVRRGNYLEGQEVVANLHVVYDLKKKTLNLRRQKIYVNQTAIAINALFDFGHQPSLFHLELDASFLDFKKGIAFLPRNISKKLEKITVSKPVSVHTFISGSFIYPDTPSVTVRASVKNNNLATTYGVFDEVTFNAVFNNHLQAGRGKGDDNSGIFISNLKGNWMGMPVVADSVAVSNLIHPRLYLKIKGDFPTTKLNKILGYSFAITKGATSFQLTYKGPVMATDTFPRSLNGYIMLKNADLTYLPRALKFSNCNAALVFQNNDLYIKTMSLGLGKSTVLIRGKGYGFLNSYFSGKSKAVFDCLLEAPEVDLNDFKPLLSSRKQYNEFSSGQKDKKIGSFNKKLDLLLDKSTMLLHMNIQKIDFNKFTASQITANLKMDADGIALNDVKLKHADGFVTFSALIHQHPQRNSFSLNAALSNLKINELFYSFSNFGQSTLKSENLKGRLSADIDLRGSLTENAQLVPKSLQGKVRFKIVNGELNNFPPFLSISKFVFKNRNLEHITFQTLSNELKIADGKIEIPSMDIASSAISITVQGIYAFESGTDISLKIPLRNPQKDKERLKMGLKPKRNKGIIVYLRAKDDKDGTVRIGWDPNQKHRLTDSAIKAD